MPHVVVTGASGYLGGVILDRFLAEGWEATALVRDPARLHPRHQGRVAVLVGDLAQGPPPFPAADALVHAAAEMRLHLSLEGMRPATVLGTRHAMQAALKAGIPRAVHLSSAAVYGFEASIDGADESLPWAPSKWPYTLSKREAESEARAAEAQGLGLCILRPGFVYGPHDTRTLPPLVQMLQKGQLKQLIDGGRIDVGPCHEATLAEAAFLGATLPQALGEAFNVGDGEALTLAQMGRDLAEALGVPAPSGNLPKALAMPLAGAVAWGWRLTKGPFVEPPLHPFLVVMLSRSAGISCKKASQMLAIQGRHWKIETARLFFRERI